MIELIERIIGEDWKQNVLAGTLAGVLAASPMTADASTKKATTISMPTEQQLRRDGIDKRLYDTIFAEAGYSTMPDEELYANVSCYLNLIDRFGYEKALNRSSAYKTKSKQYKMASQNKLNAFELKHYNRIVRIMNDVLDNPSKRMPIDHHEMVSRYGNPPWVGDMVSYKDIGMQRYYTSKALYKKLGKKI